MDNWSSLNRLAARCYNCGNFFPIPSGLAGESVKCPTCGTLFEAISEKEEDNDSLSGNITQWVNVIHESADFFLVSFVYRDTAYEGLLLPKRKVFVYKTGIDEIQVKIPNWLLEYHQEQQG